jgi:hypothetical protein
MLSGVYLLHPGPPTSEERLHAALLYAGRPVVSHGTGKPVRTQSPTTEGARAPYGEAVITGLAALALHGFSSAPPLLTLDRIDVLVPHTRRLRSSGFVRLLRTEALPLAQEITGIPVATVPRAVADAAAQLSDATAQPSDAPAMRRLLTEAVRGGHCEPAAVVRELIRARLLNRPHVVNAVDALLTEGRAIAEDRLYEMVRLFGLPEPVWNVDLRLPDGPYLGGVDAYWPTQAVAVKLDTRAPRYGDEGYAQGYDEEAVWSEYARKHEQLDRLGITVVHITPRKLRESLEQQATVVRTALTGATDREPAAYVVVLPR